MAITLIKSNHLTHWKERIAKKEETPRKERETVKRGYEEERLSGS
jgi:hypothetical protein